MLLRFSIANHLSMKGRQELSLVASPLKDDETNLIDCNAVPTKRVLPAAVIYGANASGKSNLVAAMGFMRAAVLLSHSKGDPEGGVPRQTFALDPDCAKAPSICDIDFIAGGVRYHYGFEASDDAFEAEWLHAFPKGSRQTLFERNGQTFKFGRELKGRNKVIADLTRPNSLFLSAAVQNDHKQLSKVIRFFRSLRINRDISIEGEATSMHFEKKGVDVRAIEFLKNIGTGVVDYRRKETEVSEANRTMRQEIGLLIQKFVREADEEAEIDLEGVDKDIAIELAHQGRDGKPIFFDLDRESAGTRRLLVLLGQIFRVLDEGAVLVIDELDASLHTRACEAVLALFSSPETNPNGAQLIATTHDTNLLRSPLLRRDQVWFTEKDSEGATHLYPLTDIRTRKEDNIAKGYLQGRYGAVPFSGPVSKLAETG